MDPHPRREPGEQIILKFRPEPGPRPPGLLDAIADLLRAEQPPAPPADDWQAPPTAVAVEAQLLHAIDELSTENRRRVEARDQPRPPAANPDEPPAAAPPPVPDVAEAAAALRRVVRRLSQKYTITVEVEQPAAAE